MGIIFDEMAFMEPTEGNRSSADECYAAAEPSLAQFGRDGIVFLNSSPYTKQGIFYKKFEQSHELNAAGQPAYPDLFTLQFPSWELFKDYKRKRHPKTGKPIYTKALMVSPDVDPDTLNEEDAAICRREKLREAANPDKYKIERRAQWAEVIQAYLNAEKVDMAFAPQVGERQIIDNAMGTYAHQPYVMHCDPSSTTAGFGFAIAHLEELPHPTTGAVEPHVVFDLVHRWDPKDSLLFPTGTIDYIKVCEELLRYCLLFRPRSLTFDQWNSAAPMQWLMQKLQEQGIPTMIQEVTATRARNWNRWEFFKTALYTGRVHIPPTCMDSDYAKMELKNLQLKNGIVDKPTDGMVQTKDIADCIAECTRVLLSDVMGWNQESLVDVAFGSMGGYPLGGSGHPLQGQMNEFVSARKAFRSAPAGASPTRGMSYRNGGRGRGY